MNNQNQCLESSPKRAALKGSRRHRQGAILVLCALFLPLILLIGGFGLYIAKAQLLRSELRTATDFAARAGAKRLSMDQSPSAAVAGAIDAASRNTVSGAPMALPAGSVTLGESRQAGGLQSRFEFNAGGSRPNAVRVEGVAPANDPVFQLLGGLTNVSSQDFELPAVATNLDRDICVVIDRSGSMTQPVNSTNNGTLNPCGPLPRNSRFAALSRAVDVFISELDRTPQDELICLASYSSAVNIRCRTRVRFPQASIDTNLSANASALQSPIRSMLSNGIGGATAVGSGLREGLKAVKGTGARPFAFPTIVLMTDGNHNLGVSPVVVAREAASQGVVVHTITFSRGANQSLMRQVADLTGGRHLHADDAGSLNEAFREIARTLPVMLTD